MRNSPAFTLIELLLVIAIVGLVSGGVLFSFARTSANQELVGASEQLADNLRRAHIFSRESRKEVTWGIRATTTDSYNLINGQPGISEMVVTNHTLPTGVTFLSPFLIWFARGTGYISSDTVVTLRNTNNRRIDLTISANGVIEVIPQ